MAKCKNCTNLYNLSYEDDVIVGKWCPKINNNIPDVEAERKCGYYKCITQGDRIRSMSDEELEEFISKVNRTCVVDALGGDTQCDYEDVNCTECKAKFCGIQKWLQSEVEAQSMKWLMRKILKQVVKLYFFVDKECYCFYIGTKHPNYDYTVIKNIYPD